jgi:hypothetical protein
MARQTKLIQGYSSASISKNIGYELGKHSKMGQAQAVAIALSTARSAAPKNMKSQFNPPKKGR